MELLKTYNDIITNQSKWNPTLVNIGVNFTELFDPNKFETQNLLTSLLFWESNTCDFAINTHKIRCNMGYNVTVKSPYGLRTAYRSERIFQTARFLLQTLTEKISIQGDSQKWSKICKRCLSKNG